MGKLSWNTIAKYPLQGKVYKRSYDICMQLYEKELLTDSSYLYIHGQNSAAFEAAVEQLKERRMERASEEKTSGADESKATLPLVASASVEATWIKASIGGSNSAFNCLLGLAPASVPSSEMQLRGSKTGIGRSQGVVHSVESGNVKSEAGGHVSPLARETTSGRTSGTSVLHLASRATVQVSNKPSSAFGALLGTSGKRKTT